MTKDLTANCKIHKNCHVDNIQMGYQGLIISAGKSQWFETHQKIKKTKHNKGGRK